MNQSSKILFSVMAGLFLWSLGVAPSQARQAGNLYTQFGFGGVFSNESKADFELYNGSAENDVGGTETDNPYNACEKWQNRSGTQMGDCNLDSTISYKPGWEIEGAVGYYLTSDWRFGLTIGYRNFAPDEIDFGGEQLIYALNGSSFYEDAFDDDGNRIASQTFFPLTRLGPLVNDGFLSDDLLARYNVLTSGNTANERQRQDMATFLANAHAAYQSEFTDNLTIDGVTITANAYWTPTLNQVANLVGINITDYIVSHKDHQPYIGFGLGLVIWDMDFDGSFGGHNFGDIADPAPSFTFNFALGYDYQLTEYLSVGGFYRFNWVAPSQIDMKGLYNNSFSSIDLGGVAQHNLMATVTLYYDSKPLIKQTEELGTYIRDLF